MTSFGAFIEIHAGWPCVLSPFFDLGLEVIVPSSRLACLKGPFVGASGRRMRHRLMEVDLQRSWDWHRVAEVGFKARCRLVVGR